MGKSCCHLAKGWRNPGDSEVNPNHLIQKDELKQEEFHRKAPGKGNKWASELALVDNSTRKGMSTTEKRRRGPGGLQEQCWHIQTAPQDHWVGNEKACKEKHRSGGDLLPQSEPSCVKGHGCKVSLKSVSPFGILLLVIFLSNHQSQHYWSCCWKHCRYLIDSYHQLFPFPDLL